MSNILITAPSLDESLNVSGISSLTRTIINKNSKDHTYFHFILGKKDSEKKGFKWLIRQIVLVPRFMLFISKNKIDFIHMNSDLTPQSIVRDFSLATTARFLLSKKVLLHLNGGRFLMKPPKRFSFFFWMIKGILKTASSRIILSRVEYEIIQKHYNVDCHIMPNAIELVTGTLPKDFSGKLSFLFMGRIVKSKGIFLIAECLGQLGPYFREFDFKIYGTGPDLEEFLFKLSEIEELDYTYCGVAKDEQKTQAFNAAHIFLLPSLYGEGLPLAMLESMNYGCVPLVSNDASIGAAVRDGVNGYMVDKGSLVHLKEQFIEILNDRAKLIDLSNQAKKTIETSYNSESFVKLLNNAYKNLDTWKK